MPVVSSLGRARAAFDVLASLWTACLAFSVVRCELPDLFVLVCLAVGPFGCGVALPFAPDTVEESTIPASEGTHPRHEHGMMGIGMFVTR